MFCLNLFNNVTATALATNSYSDFTLIEQDTFKELRERAFVRKIAT